MLKPASLIVIAGPTASGKSALAIKLAKLHNGEIICADSRTVYKGMDIGTAKPTAADRRVISHHLLDVVEPNEPFSVAEFKELALKAMADIHARGKLPILVGGTGLYIDAVIFDFKFGTAANPGERQKLQELTVCELQRLCVKRGYSLPINILNKRHLIRAVELKGQISAPKRMRSNTIVVSLTTNKEDLRSRITNRAHAMVEEGVVEEVERLGRIYGWDTDALTGNIYRIFRSVVDGSEPVEGAIEKIVISDLQLAKRQITWLKRNPYIVWGTPDQLTLAIEHFVQQNKLIESMPAPPLSATI